MEMFHSFFYKTHRNGLQEGLNHYFPSFSIVFFRKPIFLWWFKDSFEKRPIDFWVEDLHQLRLMSHRGELGRLWASKKLCPRALTDGIGCCSMVISELLTMTMSMLFNIFDSLTIPQVLEEHLGSFWKEQHPIRSNTPKEIRKNG